MGAGLSQNLKPEELHEFRKLNPSTTAHDVNIPARPEDRVATNKNFLIAFIAAIILLFPFLIYCLLYTDIRRLSSWTDTCGNLCGHENKIIDGIPCSGRDFTNATFMQLSRDVDPKIEDWTSIDRECVSSCNAYYKTNHLLKICYPESEAEVSGGVSNLDDFLNRNDKNSRITDENEESFGAQLRWWKFILTIIIGVFLTLILMLLLRYAPAVVVWTCLALTIALFVGAAATFWYFFFKFKDTVTDKQRSGYQVAAILFTIIAIIVVVVIAVLFKRVRLVVLLLKETTKAIFDMPLLITIPILNFVLQAIVLALFGTTVAFLLTYGKLKQNPTTGFYDYQEDPLWIFTMVYNAIITLWILQFISGCQFMTVSGAVASWYFAKNKRYLESPIRKSIKILSRFHLGSVAFGSLVITIITVIRLIIESLTKNEKLQIIIEQCMSCIEGIIKFLTKNAYIVTAIHGQPFYKSGKRAAKLLLSNIVNLAAVSSVGGFVLGVAQLLIIAIGTGLSYLMFSRDIFGTIISFIIILVIVVTGFSVFTTTIDTMFICFCEDSNINDGMARPYYMSKGLMEFIEASKKVLGEKKMK